MKAVSKNALNICVLLLSFPRIWFRVKEL